MKLSQVRNSWAVSQIILKLFYNYIIQTKMQSNKSSLETRFHELCLQMTKAAGIKTEELSKVQRTVILAHLANQQFGLQCVNRNGEVLPFPQHWSEAKQGVYKFNYKIKPKQGAKNDTSKVIQFRFVNNHQDDGTLSINYSVEDSQQLNQYQFKYEKEKIEESVKEQKLKGKGQQGRSGQNQQHYQPQTQQYRNLEPQWRTPGNNIIRDPQPLFVPNRGGGFNAPFIGGQYIGPDNQIFRGRGNNPFDPMNQPPFNDPRRPPGSRFDPLDPFGNKSLDEKPKGDFSGFNEFGQPRGGNQGGFNPGKFL